MSFGKRAACVLSLAFMLASGAFDPDDADAGSRKKRRSAPTYNPPKAHIVVDAGTGAILEASNIDAPRHPASMTKIMTLMLLFDALDKGVLSLNDPVVFSSHAASRSPVKLGMRPGGTITVAQAIEALAIKSANDAAAAVAEKIGGTEEDFAALMTKKAKEIGMANTLFVNASGLPDERQITTARDMATLCQHLIRNYQKYYYAFSDQDFRFRGRTHRNHNGLLFTYKDTDGIKTGFVRASGYNLAASAVRNGHRLIGVIFGGRSSGERNRNMKKLLDESFLAVTTSKQNVKADQSAPAPSL